jgi:hypothetical protein
LMKMAADGRRHAAPVNAYAGPAMLSGRRSGFLFMKCSVTDLRPPARDETQGQTFTKRVGQLVLLALPSVADDPTLKNSWSETVGHLRFRRRGCSCSPGAGCRSRDMKNF